MRYVYRQPRGKALYFQRHFPRDVVAPTKKFSMPMGVTESDTHAAKLLAAARCSAAYDATVAQLRNSSFDASLIVGADALAGRALKQHGFDDGDLASGSNVLLIMRGIVADGYEATHGVPPAPEKLDELMQQVTEGLKFLPRDLIPGDGPVADMTRERLAERLTTRPSDGQPQTLADLWEPYCRYKSISMDNTNARYRKRYTDWSLALSEVGNHRLEPGTDKLVNAGVARRVNRMLEDGVLPRSAARSVSTILAVARWADRSYDYGWSIKRPIIPQRQQRQRYTASVTEVITMVKAAIEWDDHFSVIGILASHGIIPSEIAHCSYEGLSADIPHIVLPAGKTQARARVTPIAYGVDTLLPNMAEAVDYSRKAANAGATFNKRLKKLFGSDTPLTLY